MLFQKVRQEILSISACIEIRDISLNIWGNLEMRIVNGFMRKENKIRWIKIGLVGIARLFTENLKFFEEADLVIVASANASRASDCAKVFEIFQVYSSYFRIV